MEEREQIINFLLHAVDAKNQLVEQLQRQIAELQKQLAQNQVSNSQ
jgi:hypothetical protein